MNYTLVKYFSNRNLLQKYAASENSKKKNIEILTLLQGLKQALHFQIYI